MVAGGRTATSALPLSLASIPSAWVGGGRDGSPPRTPRPAATTSSSRRSSRAIRASVGAKFRLGNGVRPEGHVPHRVAAMRTGHRRAGALSAQGRQLPHHRLDGLIVCPGLHPHRLYQADAVPLPWQDVRLPRPGCGAHRRPHRTMMEDLGSEKVLMDEHMGTVTAQSPGDTPTSRRACAVAS